MSHASALKKPSPTTKTASQISKAPAKETHDGKVCDLPKFSSGDYKKVGSHYEPRKKATEKISVRSMETKENQLEEIEQIVMYTVEEAEEEYTSEEKQTLMVPIPHYQLDEFKIKELDQKALFPKVAHQDADNIAQITDIPEDKPSILVTGFGMRNLKSLQDLLAEEEKRLYELYKRQQMEQEAMEAKTRSSTSTTTTKKSSVKSSETSTEKETVGGDVQLQYLMGLEQQDTEEYMPVKPAYEEKDEFTYSSSVSMRKAQKYLRVHRIFDFFQYIIAQLLSAAPDNPIQYILELLNKCLLYRSGAGEPPLLYEIKHFEQLFYLMDRMNTGYIDMEQYRQGMKTFGICEYNSTPLMTYEGISKETFREEVQEAQLAMFDDLIRKKIVDRIPKQKEFAPINYELPKVEEKKSTYLMPDDLFKSYKKEKIERIKEEMEMDEG